MVGVSGRLPATGISGDDSRPPPGIYGPRGELQFRLQVSRGFSMPEVVSRGSDRWDLLEEGNTKYYRELGQCRLVVNYYLDHGQCRLVVRNSAYHSHM